jgi:hypothetical protein
MKYLQMIVEGDSEETFVKDVLEKHFSSLGIYISARKVITGWDRINNKPAKGGGSGYIKLKNDISNWIKSDRGRANTYYTTFIDLYAFPKDSGSPYSLQIQNIADSYKKIQELEAAMAKDIDHPSFIPYVQLHEFETLLMVEPDRLLVMFPDAQKGIRNLKQDIGSTKPEEINESPKTAPSKRIIKYIPDYKSLKAQVGPMIAEAIGLNVLRAQCPHFNEWITKLENI